ncbi:isochorismatase family protein [Streptomyces sp. SBT349]|uniref:isochorismatase family protein n=1 Tax=Streptomyces sp. SBT349 TaxID=1580539 RepID=UPI00066D38DD|nr:isochorismatase family protein [Streptomyces sp. SBT349]
MADFSSILDDHDAAVFAASGYGRRAGFGERPVLLVVDVNHNFCGDRPEPILDSIRRWRNSCGEAAWEALPRIAELLAAAREHGIPVVYSTGEDPGPGGIGPGRWADKNSRRAEDGLPRPVGPNEILPQIAPRPTEVVIRKPKPSAFFASQLTSLLVDLRADSLVVCGTTTSGCVRATVLDGFSHNYRMSVVEECTFDRGRLSHRVNLFDMDQKYADVVSLAETVEHFATLPGQAATGAGDDGKR